MRTTHCRACGAEIVFVVSAAGKAIPCDAAQVTYWQRPGGSHRIVTPNGEVVSAELSGESDRATGIGYISHFATCPHAASFRRRE